MIRDIGRNVTEIITNTFNATIKVPVSFFDLATWKHNCQAKFKKEDTPVSKELK